MGSSGQGRRFLRAEVNCAEQKQGDQVLQQRVTENLQAGALLHLRSQGLWTQMLPWLISRSDVVPNREVRQHRGMKSMEQIQQKNHGAGLWKPHRQHRLNSSLVAGSHFLPSLDIHCPLVLLGAFPRLVIFLHGYRSHQRKHPARVSLSLPARSGA